MRRVASAAALVAGLVTSVCVASRCGTPPVAPAFAETADFYAAQSDFLSLEPPLRQFLQVWLITAGYMNAVPNEQFSTRTFHALQQFQIQNGFIPNGRLDKTEIDRLLAIVEPMLGQWGFRKVVLPGHDAALWVPFGLDLDSRATDKGFRYEDRQGRFKLAFLALPGVNARAALDALVTKERALGTTIHYGTYKDGWFALSTTKVDGSDHYYRYHQDGAYLTGFVMDWNNAAGNVNAERIAVLDSAVLAASMNGERFIDPPHPRPQAEAQATPPAPTPAQPITVPVAPPPPPAPAEQKGFSTGTGFFVTDVGHLITNAHVIKGCSDIAIKAPDGAITPAVELATDAANDLALLKVKTMPAKVATIRISTRLGEGVEAFGFPHSDVLSSNGNFTLGNVSALTGMHDGVRYLQISAPVQAGNSGGPLLDGSGNVVGVVSAKLDAVKMMLASDDLPQNVNFAVKAAMVAQFLDANSVTYKTGTPAATPLPPADLADLARAMSAFVVCR